MCWQSGLAECSDYYNQLGRLTPCCWWRNADGGAGHTHEQGYLGTQLDAQGVMSNSCLFVLNWWCGRKISFFTGSR